MPRDFPKLSVLFFVFVYLFSAPVRAQEADVFYPVSEGSWLAFSLPEDFVERGHSRKTYRFREGSVQFEVVPLLEHPGIEAISELEKLKTALDRPNLEDRHRFHNPLVAARRHLGYWSKLAFNVNEYQFEGSDRQPHPLSLQTRDVLVELKSQLLALRSFEPDEPGTTEAVRKGRHSVVEQLETLTSDKTHLFLVRLVGTLYDRGSYELGTLTSRQLELKDKDALIVNNKTASSTDEILFLTVDGRHYAFLFRGDPQSGPDRTNIYKTLTTSARHTDNKPAIKTKKPPAKNLRVFTTEKHAQNRNLFILLITLWVLNSQYKRAELAWEICRSRQSLSTRETWRTFCSALSGSVVVGLVILLGLYFAPGTSDHLSQTEFAPETGLPVVGALGLSALLSTLGARVGCRFGKRGSQYCAALGILVGLGLLGLSILWLLSPTGEL